MTINRDVVYFYSSLEIEYQPILDIQVISYLHDCRVLAVLI